MLNMLKHVVVVVVVVVVAASVARSCSSAARHLCHGACPHQRTSTTSLYIGPSYSFGFGFDFASSVRV